MTGSNNHCLAPALHLDRKLTNMFSFTGFPQWRRGKERRQRFRVSDTLPGPFCPIM